MDVKKEFGFTEAQLRRILMGKKYKPRTVKVQHDHENFKFGIVSDTHLCSVHERLNELHAFYGVCKENRITDIVHAGDVVCGWGIYKGQENEVKVFGAGGQSKYVIDNYPSIKGITTYFCTGNHDLSFWNRSGVDVGGMIASERPDMIYLGQYQGQVEFDGVKVRMLHPDGGGAYALSYKAQKIAEQIPSGNKPHILVMGHFHTSHYFFYRNIHILNAGCFESQSTFLLRKGINPTIGGWIVEVSISKDRRHTLLNITPKFVPFVQ